MKPPRLLEPYPDRHLECQEALEASVIDILEKGSAAGWSKAELCTAFIEVVDNIMLADAANADLDHVLGEARAADWQLPDHISRILRAFRK